jgi:hypothetical protein
MNRTSLGDFPPTFQAATSIITLLDIASPSPICASFVCVMRQCLLVTEYNTLNANLVTHARWMSPPCMIDVTDVTDEQLPQVPNSPHLESPTPHTSDRTQGTSNRTSSVSSDDMLNPVFLCCDRPDHRAYK